MWVTNVETLYVGDKLVIMMTDCIHCKIHLIHIMILPPKSQIVHYHKHKIVTNINVTDKEFVHTLNFWANWGGSLGWFTNLYKRNFKKIAKNAIFLTRLCSHVTQSGCAFWWWTSSISFGWSANKKIEHPRVNFLLTGFSNAAFANAGWSGFKWLT